MVATTFSSALPAGFWSCLSPLAMVFMFMGFYHHQCLADASWYNDPANSTWYHYNKSIVMSPLTTEDAKAASARGLSRSAPTFVQEYELDRRTESDPNMLSIFRMQNEGVMGYVSAIAVRGPNELLVLHRGAGRCCNGWCGAPVGSCGTLGVIPQPIVYWLKDGVVVRSYGANIFRFPHAISQDPDEKHAWVVDQVYDQAFQINLWTGAIDMVLGSYWAEPLVGPKYPLSVNGKATYFTRLMQNPENFGLLCMPTSVSVARSAGLVFVGSGYCDLRVVVFNMTTGQPMYAIQHDVHHTGFFLNIPHDILVREATQHVIVANREWGTVDMFGYDGTFLSSWDVRAYGKGRPFSIRSWGGSRMLVNILGQDLLSGAIVELDSHAPGMIIRAYSVPVGMYPQHYLDFWEDEEGTLHLYIASPVPEYYTMSTSAEAAEDTTLLKVPVLLKTQWLGVLLATLVLPVTYFIWACGSNMGASAAKAKTKPSSSDFTRLDTELELAPHKPTSELSVVQEAAAGAAVLSGPAQSNVFFVSTGEDAIMAQGAYAGIIDAPLTPFGRGMAADAGLDVRDKELRFDYVYCSHLQRCADTALHLLRAAGQSGLEQEIVPDKRLAERSFGIFSGKSVRLIWRSIGYSDYLQMMHSPEHNPPLGESLPHVYQRVTEFFKEEVEPKIAAGKKVLVVTHQYPLEMLGAYMSDRPGTEYQAMVLPVGKVLGCRDLRRAYREASKLATQGRHWLQGVTASFNYRAGPVIFLLSVILHVWMGRPLWSDTMSMVLITICMFCLTFLGFLGLDPKYCFTNCPLKALALVVFQTAARFIVATVVLVLVSGNTSPNYVLTDLQVRGYMTCLAMVWMVPTQPALPLSSTIWGGSMYLTVVVTLLSNALLPLLLALYMHLGLITSARPAMPSLPWFWVLYVVGFILPSLLAVWWGHYSKSPMMRSLRRKGWLGSVLYWLLLVCAVQMFTPNTLLAALNINVSSFLGRPAIVAPLQLEKRYQRNIQITAMQSFVVAVANMLFMRLSAAVCAWLLSYWQEGDKEPGTKQSPLAARLVQAGGEFTMTNPSSSLRLMNCIDCYISLISPNIFVYATLTYSYFSVAHLPVGEYMMFWTMLVSFIVPAIEQGLIRNMFLARMLQQSLQSASGSMQDEATIRRLWDKFQIPLTGSLHPSELVRNLQRLQGGEVPQPSSASLVGRSQMLDSTLQKYMEAEMKGELALAGGGTMSYEDFKQHIKQGGGALNAPPSSHAGSAPPPPLGQQTTVSDALNGRTSPSPQPSRQEQGHELVSLL